MNSVNKKVIQAKIKLISMLLEENKKKEIEFEKKAKFTEKMRRKTYLDEKEILLKELVELKEQLKGKSRKENNQANLPQF